jgi:very-short-patch-repair endonuclease
MVPGIQSGLPSPLAGEGGSAQRAETDEGALSSRRAESSSRTKSLAKTLRRKQTDVEKRMWAVLRDRRFDGVKFRRQVPIGNYIADFLCYEARLIVELDGSQHGDSIRDAVRDDWLRSNGYRVLRFWNTDVTLTRNAVIQTIWAELQTQQAPSSGASRHLLPRGEKGGPERAATREIEP